MNVWPALMQRSANSAALPEEDTPASLQAALSDAKKEIALRDEQISKLLAEMMEYRSLWMSACRYADILGQSCSPNEGAGVSQAEAHDRSSPFRQAYSW